MSVVNELVDLVNVSGCNPLNINKEKKKFNYILNLSYFKQFLAVCHYIQLSSQLRQILTAETQSVFTKLVWTGNSIYKSSI